MRRVLLIVGTVAVLGVGGIWALSVARSRDEHLTAGFRRQRAYSECLEIAGLVAQWRDYHGVLPDTLREYEAQEQATYEKAVANLLAWGEDTEGISPPAPLPMDPWGRSYRLRANEDGTFRVGSNGPDGERHTDDDIFYLHRGGYTLPPAADWPSK